VLPHATYHGGRLVAYVLLGAIAGAIGARLDDLGALAGVARAAAIITGSLMVLWALGEIVAMYGVRVPPLGASPEWARKFLGRAILAVGAESPATKAGVIGLLTSLLPCGWLYAFVLTAGGTGDTLAGMAVMAAFWAGTVPILLGVGLGAQQLLARAGRGVYVFSALVVLALGLLSITGRVSAPRMQTIHERLEGRGAH
jgi:sulfite exporter TauE/SafE